MMSGLHFMIVAVRHAAAQDRNGQWEFGKITAAAKRWSVELGSIREDQGTLAPDHIAGAPTSPEGVARHGTSNTTLGDVRYLPTAFASRLFGSSLSRSTALR